MSRTDAHRPYRVWLADHPQHAVALHSHAAHGASLCDLPPDRTVAGTRCRWELPYYAGPRCSCALCGGGPWHRLDTRRRRQQERLALRQRPHDLDGWAELVVGLPDR
jgi:hypothetical protein